MKVESVFLSFLMAMLIMAQPSCSPAVESGQKEEIGYEKLVRELHELECEHLRKQNQIVEDTGVYAYRAAAFHAVLKDTDRNALVRYEELHQALARIEYGMSGKEHIQYCDFLNKVYAEGCAGR
jgi:hypothetical protein